MGQDVRNRAQCRCGSLALPETASRLRRQVHGRLELKGLFSKAFGEADAYCEGPRLCYSGRVKRKCNLLGHDMVVLHTLASCVQEL